MCVYMCLCTFMFHVSMIQKRAFLSVNQKSAHNDVGQYTQMFTKYQCCSEEITYYICQLATYVDNNYVCTQACFYSDQKIVECHNS